MFSIDWPAPFYYIFTFIDILIVSFILYKAITYVFQDRILGILKGLMAVGIIFASAHFFKLKILLWLFEKAVELLPLAILILFQQEIRRLLSHIGALRIFQKWSYREEQETYQALQKVFASLKLLAERKIGAIILLEREMDLKDIKEKSIPLDADVSEQLLVSVFTPTTPLHDGAVIIKGGKILVARAFFPITEERIAPYLGSRHRAAIGISENSDAVALVVSEENGYVSLAYQGKIFYNIGLEKLKEKTLQIFGYGS